MSVTELVQSRLHLPALAVGVSGIVVVVATLFEGPELADGASGEAVRRHLEGNLTAIGSQVTAQTVAFLALLLFTVALRALMRPADGEPRTLTNLATVSGLLTALWMWVQASVDMIPLVMADDDGTMNEYSNDTLLTLDLMDRFGETFGDVATVPRGLLVLAVSVLAVTTRFIPRWTGYFGLVVAAACLVSVLGLGWPIVFFSVTWFVGLFGFMLWLLCLSVTMFVVGVRGRADTRSMLA